MLASSKTADSEKNLQLVGGSILKITLTLQNCRINWAAKLGDKYKFERHYYWPMKKLQRS